MRHPFQDIQNVQPAHATSTSVRYAYNCHTPKTPAHRVQHAGPQKPTFHVSPAVAANGATKISINDNVKGRLPGFVRGLNIQTLDAGTFTATNISWKAIHDNSKVSLVAAIPAERVPDFLAREGQRGNCSINLEAINKPSDSIISSDRPIFKFSATRKAPQQEMQRMCASDAPQPYVPNTQARKGAHQKGTSCKLGYGYLCYIKRYTECQGVAILKFQSRAGEAATSCPSMAHCRSDGAPAHDDPELACHLREYTPKMTEFALQRLRAGIKVSIIRDGTYTA